MADTEKVLNTRIINKHANLITQDGDTVKGWDQSTLALKEGEIALAKITTKEQHSDGTSSEVPAYLVKIGVEGKTFSETAWAYAKAADVYSWAKQSELPVVCADNTQSEDYIEGNVISSITFEDGKIKYTTATVATSQGLADLTDKVTAIEGYLEITTDDGGNVTVGLVDRVTDLENIVKGENSSEAITETFENLLSRGYGNSIIDILQSIIGYGDLVAENGSLTDINNRLNNIIGTDQEHWTDISKIDNRLTSVELVIDGENSINVQGYNGNIKDILNAIVGDFGEASWGGLEGITLKKLEDAINALYGYENLEDRKSVYTLDTEITNHITNKENPHNVTKAQVGLGNVENKSVSEIKTDITGTIADGDEGFVTGDAVYDIKQTADAAKARIDAFIDGTEDATSAIDTLVEIQQFMTDDTGAFVALSNKVTNIENGTTVVPKAADAGTFNGKSVSDFATADQGTKADTSVQGGLVSFANAGYEPNIDGDPIKVEREVTVETVFQKADGTCETGAFKLAANNGLALSYGLNSAGTVNTFGSTASFTIGLDDTTTFIFDCGGAE